MVMHIVLNNKILNMPAFVATFIKHSSRLITECSQRLKYLLGPCGRASTLDGPIELFLIAVLNPQMV